MRLNLKILCHNTVLLLGTNPYDFCIIPILGQFFFIQDKFLLVRDLI